MDQPEPPETRPDPEATEDMLRRLEARLDRASAAAERLVSEAAARIGGAGAGGARAGGAPPSPNRSGLAGQPASAGGSAASAPEFGGGEPPPAGWQVPGQDGSTPGRDLDLLIGVVQSLRDLIPDELQRRLSEALRELLLAMRALIDWYLERMERRRTEPAEVQDIPIE